MDTFSLLQSFCLSLPGVVEEYPWGEVAFKVKGKLIAVWSPATERVTVKTTPEHQSALIQDPSVEVASHVGKYGWVSIDPKDPALMELAHELIRNHYAELTGPVPGRKRGA